MMKESQVTIVANLIGQSIVGILLTATNGCTEQHSQLLSPPPFSQ